MELKIFFDKVDEQVYENIQDTSSFFHHISVHNTQFPEWQTANIALIGLNEERGNAANTGAALAANAVREKLYRLKRGASRVRVVDLGNLRNGAEQTDTIQRLKEIGEMLIEKGILVVLLGGTHDLDYGQYLAYEKLGKTVTMVCVDAIADLFPNGEYTLAQSHLHHIIVYEPNYLFHLCHLANQNFLNEVFVQEALEKLHFENVRIGQMRENFTEMEPLIRQADMISFDIGAIKKADAPGNKQSNVFGLTAEEACQLAWYAGLNDKLTSFGLYEYNPTVDVEDKTAFVLATMIWYLVEGYDNRKGDLEFNDKHFMRYMVSIGKEPDQVIVFYKSRLSEKWWMEVPYATQPNHHFKQTSLVPCSYSDYETALKGEMPNRWILMHGKLF